MRISEDEALAILSDIGKEDFFNFLFEIFENNQYFGPEITKIIMDLTSHSNDKISIYASRALSGLQDPQCEKFFISQLENQIGWQEAWIYGLANIKGSNGVPIIIKCLKNPDLFQCSLEALDFIGAPSAGKELREYAFSTDAYTRTTVVKILGKIQDQYAVQTIVNSIDSANDVDFEFDEARHFAKTALWALSNIGNSEAKIALFDLAVTESQKFKFNREKAFFYLCKVDPTSIVKKSVSKSCLNYNCSHLDFERWENMAQMVCLTQVEEMDEFFKMVLKPLDKMLSVRVLYFISVHGNSKIAELVKEMVYSRKIAIFTTVLRGTFDVFVKFPEVVTPDFAKYLILKYRRRLLEHNYVEMFSQCPSKFVKDFLFSVVKSSSVSNSKSIFETYEGESAFRTLQVICPEKINSIICNDLGLVNSFSKQTELLFKISDRQVFIQMAKKIIISGYRDSVNEIFKRAAIDWGWSCVEELGPHALKPGVLNTDTLARLLLESKSSRSPYSIRWREDVFRKKPELGFWTDRLEVYLKKPSWQRLEIELPNI